MINFLLITLNIYFDALEANLYCFTVKILCEVMKLIRIQNLKRLQAFLFSTIICVDKFSLFLRPKLIYETFKFLIDVFDLLLAWIIPYRVSNLRRRSALIFAIVGIILIRRFKVLIQLLSLRFLLYHINISTTLTIIFINT